MYTPGVRKLSYTWGCVPYLTPQGCTNFPVHPLEYAPPTGNAALNTELFPPSPLQDNQSLEATNRTDAVITIGLNT